MVTRLAFICTLVLILTESTVRAVPTDHKETVTEHVRGRHDSQFDHEAFLGKSESDKFDQLTPEEARRRLGLIVDRIDTDKDGYVTENELKAWVGHVGKRYIMDDVMTFGTHYDGDNDGYVTFEEYKKAQFGEDMEDENAIFDHQYKMTIKDMIVRKKQVFDTADFNGDKKLSKDELADFLHPAEAPHMKVMYVEHRMHDIDRNKDGFLTLAEYIDEVWPKSQRDSEPEWLPREKDNFASRDKDGDGKLNFEEFKQWLIPENYDANLVEAVHLIQHADTDMDQKLTKEEILQHQDVFVGSRATEWGGYLNRHDEF